MTPWQRSDDDRLAKKINPEWQVLARTQNNDSNFEDRELRFKDMTDRRDKGAEFRETDWVP